jgi:hypothetical protein
LLGLFSSVNDGLNLHSVGRIGDENWKIFSHLDLSQSELTIEVAPELGLVSFSSKVSQCDGVHANGSHDLIGGQEFFGTGKVLSKASLGQDEWSNVKGSLSTQEFDGNIRVTLG